MWDNILSGVKSVNDFLNGIVWGWPVVILILGTGILLTIRTKFLQVTHFGESLNTTIISTLKSLHGGKKKDTRLKSVNDFLNGIVW
ncbi:MAG: sodium:alanine symporter family protein, partial [Ruminococcus sp.]|nr:sodium:alanine symporter family protein [Ruminococcus sp.]